MKHETKNTLEAPRWCGKCRRSTPHRVDSGRVSNVCIPCRDRAEIEHQARLAAEKLQPVQEGLFA